ncbi:hypothetical protein E2C01_055690 [Portunus trituberculatus]|uniref:Uncharacterized protein n=1 Tax=Portunus trituberculatus TaxID=210409 RepID=A0A5B7GVG6_PORTR|nr:hypothetical protein [Portunus trituberculatus]
MSQPSEALAITDAGTENNVKELKREPDGWPLEGSLPHLACPALLASWPPGPSLSRSRVCSPISTRHVPPPAHFCPALPRAWDSSFS